MNTVIKENYEKMLLASLLLVLAATSIAAIMMVRHLPVADIIDSGENVKVDDVPAIEELSVGIAVDKGPNSLEGFIYCRNADCDYLINKTFQKCKWCSTTVIAETVFNDDTNKNSISDKLELSWGVKLNDKNDLLRDHDKDGFATLHEYERDFSPVDNSSHPPVILRASYIGKENKYIPFTLLDVITVKDVKGNEKTYVDARHNTRGGFYLFVGESTDWLKILEAGEKKGEKYAVIKYFEEVVRIVKGQRMQYKGWPKYVIKNHLNSKSVKVSLGEKFSLSALSGKADFYKLTGVDTSGKKLLITDQSIDNKYELGEDPELKAPLE